MMILRDELQRLRSRLEWLEQAIEELERAQRPALSSYKTPVSKHHYWDLYAMRGKYNRRYGAWV